jgi:hypothetical protein
MGKLPENMGKKGDFEDVVRDQKVRNIQEKTGIKLDGAKSFNTGARCWSWCQRIDLDVLRSPKELVISFHV